MKNNDDLPELRKLLNHILNDKTLNPHIVLCINLLSLELDQLKIKNNELHIKIMQIKLQIDHGISQEEFDRRTHVEIKEGLVLQMSDFIQHKNATTTQNEIIED